ncbi:MAG: hypothetical protein ACTSQP_03795 [Promethearchaeota archaeon]
MRRGIIIKELNNSIKEFEIIKTLNPIYQTLIFTLKRHWKKFTIFAIIEFLIVFSFGFLLYVLIPEYSIPLTQQEYFVGFISAFLYLILIFGTCFFFSGIICSEFSNKTGYIVFPKTGKYKFILGKFLGNLIYILGITTIYYTFMILFAYYFYGAPIITRIWLSYGIAVLYVITLSSFVTFFSSFMKNVNMTIVITILILLIAYSIAEQMVVLFNPDIEPIFSLNYLANLLSATLQKDFLKNDSNRYEDIKIEDFTYRVWLTPTIEMGITIMIIYITVCLVLAALIFKRKQL